MSRVFAVDSSAWSGRYVRQEKLDSHTSFTYWSGSVRGHAIESLELIVDDDSGLVAEQTTAFRPFPAIMPVRRGAYEALKRHSRAGILELHAGRPVNSSLRRNQWKALLPLRPPAKRLFTRTRHPKSDGGSTATSSSCPSQLVLFDAQLTPGYAREVLKIADGLDKPVTRLYISHAHPDHFVGASLDRGSQLRARPGEGADRRQRGRADRPRLPEHARPRGRGARVRPAGRPCRRAREGGHRRRQHSASRPSPTPRPPSSS